VHHKTNYRPEETGGASAVQKNVKEEIGGSLTKDRGETKALNKKVWDTKKKRGTPWPTTEKNKNKVIDWSSATGTPTEGGWTTHIREPLNKGTGRSGYSPPTGKRPNPNTRKKTETANQIQWG